MSALAEATSRPISAGLSVFQEMVRAYQPRDFAVRLWDGTVWEPDAGRAASFTLVLNHPGALRSMFWPPRPLSMGQAYIYDDFNVEGDMIAFATFCGYLADLKSKLSLGERLKLGWRIWNLPRLVRPRAGRQVARLSGTVHSKDRDREAISYHYDTSNELFRQVLDSRLTYTSGVWEGAGDNLERAQERKLDLVCRKLRLKPGDRLLDIGCGWGGLMRYAAAQYGVRALGVTISREQAKLAEGTIKAEGLEGRCRVELQDYRDVPETEPFDAITLLEVGEHFGADQFLGFFQKCWRLLRPGGQILIQQITLAARTGLAAAREFSEHYIFPDGELVPVSHLCSTAEMAGFEVRDVEGLRHHYPYTLRAWLHNLETHHDAIVAATDEATYRVFRLYFAGACTGFMRNVYQLHHILYVKPDPKAAGLPPARAEWYNGRTNRP